MNEHTTPPPTPQPQDNQVGEASSSGGPRRTRTLQDLYDSTEEVPYLSDFTQFCLFAETEHVGYDEAVYDGKWRNAMNEKIQAIKKNDTCELVSLPADKSPIGMMWVYIIKRNAKGEVKK